MVTTLRKTPLLAVDTESNSLYAYREQVCLIQLSTRTDDYIVDPLSIDQLDALGELLRNPRIEKVFHAASYDIGCLKRDYNFEVVNLFDTMWAARICSHEAFGLGNLLKRYFGVKVDKSHQRDNWGQRPLDEDSLLYAQMDTHYLPRLRDQLYRELAAGDHLEEAEEIFAEVCEAEEIIQRFDPDGFWDIGLPHSLTRKQMSILRELYLLREECAQERDLPTFKIFGNKTLVSLSLLAPTSEAQLADVEGLSPFYIRHYAVDILHAIERGRGNRLPSPRHHHPPDPIISDRFTVLSDWRKERASQRNVGSDVIISKQALWDLAHRMPKTLEEMAGIRGLGKWRIKTYGEDLLKLLRTLENGS